MSLAANRIATRDDAKHSRAHLNAEKAHASGSRCEYDVAIVGGGPAGLAGATYLSRFLRSVVVLDAGSPRAALIPKSRNCPGFPDGIGGEELLGRLREQARAYGTEIVQTQVLSADAIEDGFTLVTRSGPFHASFVILATGLVDKVPAVSGLHEGISAGLIGLCPVCDGYEARTKRVGVVGSEEDALKEALFMLTYTAYAVILANHPAEVGEAVRKQSAQAGIEIWDSVAEIAVTSDELHVSMADGSSRRLDMLYSAMGCDVRSDLATQIGADRDDNGYILVGPRSETSVPGVYAIGDVAQALNQIAVAFGQAAQAATDIHNKLRKREPRRIRSVPA